MNEENTFAIEIVGQSTLAENCDWCGYNNITWPVNLIDSDRVQRVHLCSICLVNGNKEVNKANESPE